MDILHLKYVAEIARTGSMTQAAANLYMTQPNLSRAVRELERELHIAIFNRSSKGVTLTREGQELLLRAQDPLAAFDHLESRYTAEESARRRFSISAPRAGYIARAFALFLADVADTPSLSLSFRETGSAEALDDVVQRRQNMAIVRYPVDYELYFRRTFKTMGLFSEVLVEFDELLLTSAKSPLCGKEAIDRADLDGLVEVAGDDRALSPVYGFRGLVPPEEGERRRVYAEDRASRLELLAAVPDSYLWSAALPEETLRRYGLVQHAVPTLCARQQDVLIHPKDYRLSLTDQMFLRRLYALCLAFPK